MLSFVKGIFYLSFSVVIVCSYIFTTTFLERLDNRVIEKQVRIDRYYEEEFFHASEMCNSKTAFIKDIGEKSFNEAFKNALDDGYSKAEVKTMSSKGYDRAGKLAKDLEHIDL